MKEYKLVSKPSKITVTAPKGYALQVHKEGDKNVFTMVKSRTKKYGKRIKKLN